MQPPCTTCTNAVLFPRKLRFTGRNKSGEIRITFRLQMRTRQSPGTEVLAAKTPGSRRRTTKTARRNPSGFSSGWRDLNPRPLDPQSSALPSCATARIQFVAVATCRTIAHLSTGAQTGPRGPRHKAVVAVPSCSACGSCTPASSIAMLR